jgi:cytochrome c peroxidase
MPSTTVARLACGVAVAAAVIGTLYATKAGEARSTVTEPYAHYLAQYRRPDSIPFPANNQFTRDRWELGRTLFFDTQLSGAGDLSCASCHNPQKAWGDGLPKAFGTGHKQLGRRTPTVLNTAWAAALFWDGRAETLEQQALGPIASAGEMNMPLDRLVESLNASPEYKTAFRRAYGVNSITTQEIAKAIATYERTVVSAPSPFDAWVAGDNNAVSEDAKRGFLLFNTKANCASCHSGWRFTDDSYHDIGVPSADSGRARIIPGIESIQFAFKTPTLRNAVERAPFMHDGSERTLEDVIELYDKGGRVRRPSLSPEIKPLHLTPREKRDLVAFLKTLSSGDSAAASPLVPR